MEFDRDRVYTAFEADELKTGSIVILANTPEELKRYVNEIEYVTPLEHHVYRLEIIQPPCNSARFSALNRSYNFAYLISEPEEKKLKWTDLKRGDGIRSKRTGIEYTIVAFDKREDISFHVRTVECWITDNELAEYWEKVED